MAMKLPDVSAAEIDQHQTALTEPYTAASPISSSPPLPRHQQLKTVDGSQLLCGLFVPLNLEIGALIVALPLNLSCAVPTIPRQKLPQNPA